jgi:hypothetical protein
MAIVWPTSVGVDEYAAMGRSVEVPRLGCPACSTLMGFWGWYDRHVRVGRCLRLSIRRQRCEPCGGTTHAVLPSFLTHGRLDGVEVIGAVLEAVAEARELVPELARAIEVPHTTVRGWWRRFRAHSSMLAVGFSRFCVALGGIAPRLSGHPEVMTLGAVRAAFTEAGRRISGLGVLWRFANAVIGGQLLTTNMNPSWSTA